MSEIDSNAKRKIVRNWRDYVKELTSNKDVFAWVWKELIGKETKKWLRWMVGLFVIDTLFVLAGPWCVKYVLDGLTVSNTEMVCWGIGGWFFVNLMGRIIGYFVLACREWVLGLNQGTLDERTSELFMEKSMGQHLQEHSYLSPANVEKGRNKVLGLEENLLFHGIQVLLMWSLSFLLLWFLSPVAGALMTAALIIHVAWSLKLAVNVNQEMTPIDAEMRKLNRYRVERWDSVERVKTNGNERYEVSHVKDWWDVVIAKDRVFWLWYLKHMVIRGGITTLFSVAILAYGAWMVTQGNWTIGVLFPLLAWTARVRDGFGQVSDIERMINYNLPSIKSMMHALTVESDITDGTIDAQTLGDAVQVDFNNISHGYDENQRGVLQNVHFTVEPGEKVALIGKSGAGKTTIMRAFLRYMDPNESGRILLNGTDLRDFNLQSLLHYVGYIPQQAQVLDGTLRYNLVYGLPVSERDKISDTMLWDLMHTLQIDFGDRLTDGLDTKVGRNGVKLSGGEAQRVMIGAAALKDPKLMVIDEATSSLDAVTERKVHDGLKKVLKPSMSALIITHRLPTVRDICTKFVVLRSTAEMSNGDPQVEAVASSFEELYQCSPTFRELADEQGVQIFTV